MVENGKEKTLSRKSPGKATSFDDTSCRQNFFERVAQWLDSNDLEYSEYPDRQFFSCATLVTAEIGGPSLMWVSGPMDSAC
jgi:hypothetical protein